MSGERRQRCPECGAGPGPGGGLSCACEAEGFSPLRVRPYVTLPEPSQPPPPRVPDPYAHPPLPPERPPVVADDPAGHDEHPGGRPRRAPVLLLAAVAGVLSVAALVTVLISSGDGDTRAAAQEAATPPATSPAAPHGPARGASSTPSRTAKAPAAPSSPTHSAPAAAAPPATKSAPLSATPSSSRAHPTPTSSASTASGQPRPEQATVLRRGDHGPQVSELQSRLRRLNLFAGDPDGSFDTRTEYGVRAYQLARGVQGDTPGTYGPATRKALESERR